MPRIRQRIVVCDCFDCVEQSTDPTNALVSAANEAAARQEPPPKCILFLCSGFLGCSAFGAHTDLLYSQDWPHLNRLAQTGGQGFVACRRSVSSDSAGETAQLLGVLEELSPRQRSGPLSPDSLPSLSSRFQGLQAALASNVERVQQLGAACGLRPSSALGVGNEDSSLDATSGSQPGSNPRPASWLPHPAAAVAQMLKELGVADKPAPSLPEAQPGNGGGTTDAGLPPQQGPHDPPASAHGPPAGTVKEEEEELDMLIVHVEVDSKAPSTKNPKEDETTSGTDWGYERCSEGVEWLDACVRHLNQVAAVRDTVLLCVLVSSLGQPHTVSLQPGGTSLHPGSVIMSVQDPIGDDSPAPGVSRPPQSFQSRTGKDVDVALDAPLLAVRRLPGVIRSDRTQKFSVEECAKRGGLGTILLDHLIPEIAYKLGRAPKYGA